MIDKIQQGLEKQASGQYESLHGIKKAAIALSSLPTAAGLAKGRKAGFDDDVARHDRGALLKSQDDIGGLA